MLELSLDDKAFKVKPSSQEAGLISKYIGEKFVQISEEQFVHAIGQGKTWSAKFNGNRNANNWLGQQLFAADIDEGVHTVKSVEAICDLECIDPLAIHESFSSRPEHPKLRVIFRTKELISDVQLALQIQMKLAQLFGGDSAVCDIARIYYGTNKPIAYIDKDAVLDIEALRPLPPIGIKSAEHGALDAGRLSKIALAEQMKIMRAASVGRRKLIVNILKERQQSIETLGEGSGYQSVWKAAARLGQFEELIDAFIYQAITDWVTGCPVYKDWQHMDKLDNIIYTGIKWGRKHPYA